MKKFIKRVVRYSVIGGIAMGLLGVLAVGGLYLYISPTLPDIESLKDVKFQVPLRIYSSDGKLMGEFGEKRRIPLEYDEIPEHMINAVLGAEDDRFFEHPGVDYQGILRAIGKFVVTGQKVEGGSTITMQVARNFFLSSEKTFLRKFNEIFLALRIEKELTKEEILALYLNKIYFGKRAYGVASAARTYYGKDIRDLDVAQLAMIAGLPKAPSRYNPVVNPKRALLRRNYVLRRMRDLKYIDEQTYSDSVLKEVTAKEYKQSIDVEAQYISEMVRQEMVERFGEDVYTEGYNVYTTVESRLQNRANYALRKALLDFETRHGYRGAAQKLDVVAVGDPVQWDIALEQFEDDPVLTPGVVIDLEDQAAFIYLKGGKVVHLCWSGLKWAAPYIDGNNVGRAPKTADDVLDAGDVVYLRPIGNGWELNQIPDVEGAMVSLRSSDGAIQAIVGGYNFDHSNFNRASQAKRQPGSNFKPFVYSSALEKGYTAASIINDAPVVFDDPGLEDTWRPENYSGKVFGPTRLREALVKSRNLVSIRILRSIGIRYAIDYVQRFGFDASELPRDLSLALGSATVTPLEVARGYATFSNGGYRVDPYLISRVENVQGEVIYKANPPTVCEPCEQLKLQQQEEEAARLQQTVLTLDDSGEVTELVNTNDVSDPAESSQVAVNLAPRIVTKQNVYIMTSIMRDIINRGTGRRARVLNRDDLAGKTGTTNDQRDAWFSGFNGEIATTAWVGFDKPHPLGDFESGARAALPMWITYMAEALKDKPSSIMMQPPGIVTVRIDPETGLLASADTPGAIFEIFREDRVPKRMSGNDPSGMGSSVGGSDGNTSDGIPEQLF